MLTKKEEEDKHDNVASLKSHFDMSGKCEKKLNIA